ADPSSPIPAVLTQPSRQDDGACLRTSRSGRYEGVLIASNIKTAMSSSLKGGCRRCRRASAGRRPPDGDLVRLRELSQWRARYLSTARWGGWGVSERGSSVVLGTGG